MTSAAVSIRNLSVNLITGEEERRILRNVSFEIGIGETFGLVGESGCGKSMTAKSIARLLPPSASVTGEIVVNGRDVMEMTGRELRAYRANTVAVISQDPLAHVNPVRRIGDFLTEGMRLCQGVSRKHAKARALELLNEVHLSGGERLLRQYPHELSGGMLQRVAIAAALAAKPSLLIADEPTTALDVTIQAQIMTIFDELRVRHELATLFITHDLALAAAICDKTAVMYAGSIVEMQPSKELKASPVHPYTSALIAAHPNLDGLVGQLRSIPGMPLAPYEHVKGCAFAARCTFVTEKCRVEPPPATFPAPGLVVVCHRASEFLIRQPVRIVEPDRPDAASTAPALDRDPLLAVTSLRKQFGHVVAVQDVTFDLGAGESIGIVGESGSGKTTTARMIVGLERPTAGEITFQGRNRVDPPKRLAEMRRRAAEVQMVFQNPYESLDKRQTVGAAINEIVRIRHAELSRQDRLERVVELLERVGLDRKNLGRLPRELSGGERQRVAIARAMAAGPKVIILDEAVSALDVSIQAQVINLLCELREGTGLSYVVISHNLAVVRELTDRLLVMRRGEVVEGGDTQAILERPHDDYTKILRSSVPGPDWAWRRARTAEQ